MTPNDHDSIGAQAEREYTNFLYREAELLDTTGLESPSIFLNKDEP
ncbi:MAG: hypothetical protein JWQ00_1883 [Noviherbaspirillum sp.]|jgi:hypothetical protein|nr:hypothetical protein [Noviherbaspirillum sp.]